MCYVLTGGVRGDRGALGPSRRQGGCQVSEELRIEKRERRTTGGNQSPKGNIPIPDVHRLYIPGILFNTSQCNIYAIHIS